MSQLVEILREGRVGLLHLNRPKQLNALNTELARQLIAASEELDQDPGIGCLVVTGSQCAFAAGADISEMVEMSYGEMAARLLRRMGAIFCLANAEGRCCQWIRLGWRLRVDVDV